MVRFFAKRELVMTAPWRSICLF